MPSAYDTEGRLKKHALMGTSFATDPYKKKERTQFQTLYGEAKEAASHGIGQEGMLKRLQSDWQGYASNQLSRLEQIAKEREMIQSEGEANISALTDPEKEKRFTAYQQWASLSPQTQQHTGIYKLTNMGIPSDFVKEAKRAYLNMNQSDRKAYAKDHGVPANRETMSTFIKNLWQDKYGTPQEQAYKEKLSAEVDKLQGRLVPLQEEEIDRQERLASRAELYSMFLGV